MRGGGALQDPTRRRERFLTGAEFERLGAVLNESVSAGEVSPHAADAIWLLMLTGCRKTEILALRWEEVDFERGELRLAESKTGPRTVPLSPAAGRILRARRYGPAARANVRSRR